MFPVETPFHLYTGLDGKPLDNGYVRFGVENQNPLTNPITVYWDAAGTQPAAQPLRTVNGYIMRAGSPANVFADGKYSVLVQDSKRRQVYFARSSADYSFASRLADVDVTDIIGFTQVGTGAVAETLGGILRQSITVKQFGAVGDGITDDTAAIQRAVNAAIAQRKSLVFPTATYRINTNVLGRANDLLIDGGYSTVVLGSSAAGISLAGSYNHVTRLRFVQADQTDTPTAIYLFNDAITGLSIHNKVTDCYASNVYRCVHVYMGVNGSGKACYRAIIKDCEFINKYQQKVWSGSFGISFDGPNSGDAGGNDSRVISCTVAGYERNFIIKNSVVTQFVDCSGDGAAHLFSVQDIASGIQVIGGYYEYNDNLFETVGIIKYDLYLLYPSFANYTTFSTGAGFSYISGGLPVGAPAASIANGAFTTHMTTGYAEVFAGNGIQSFTNNSKVRRLNLDLTGEWTFENGGRILVVSPMWLVTNKVEGYTGGATPLELKAANHVIVSTQNTERFRVNSLGNLVSVPTYSTTTASAANMFVSSDGGFLRSTSSGKYKTDVEDLVPDLADIIFQLRPVWYRSTCESDRPDWSWYGFIAEEVAAVEPRLVHWGYSEFTTVEVSPATPPVAAVLDDEGNEITPALPAQEAQYRREPDTNSPLVPEGVQYDRMVVHLVSVVQRQQQAIEALQARVHALEFPLG